MRSRTYEQSVAWNSDTRNVAGWAVIDGTTYRDNLISFSYTTRAPFLDIQGGSCTVVIYNEDGQLDPFYSGMFNYGDTIRLYGVAGNTSSVLLATYKLTDAQVDIHGRTLTITGADGIGDLLSRDLPDMVVYRNQSAMSWIMTLLAAYITPRNITYYSEYVYAQIPLAYHLPTYGDTLRVLARSMYCTLAENYEGNIYVRSYNYDTSSVLNIYAYQIDSFGSATNAHRIDYTYNNARVAANIAVRYGQPTIAAAETNYSNTTNDFSGYTPVGDNMRYNTEKVAINGPVAAAAYYSIVSPWVDSDTSFGSASMQKIYAQYFVDGYYTCGILPSAADNGRCYVTQYAYQVNRATKLVKGDDAKQIEEIDMEFIQSKTLAQSMRDMLATRRNKKIQQILVDYRFNPFLELLDRVRVYTYDYPTTGRTGQIYEMTCNYSNGSFNGSLVLEDIT